MTTTKTGASVAVAVTPASGEQVLDTKIVPAEKKTTKTPEPVPLTLDVISERVVAVGRKIKARQHYMSEIERLKKFDTENDGNHVKFEVRDDKYQEFKTDDLKLMKVLLDTTIEYYRANIKELSKDIEEFRLIG